MSYPHTIQAGIESLREIEYLLGRFSHEGFIPSIDLDLILQKTRNLYEVLLLLRQYQSVPDENTGQGLKEEVRTDVVKPGQNAADAAETKNHLKENTDAAAAVITVDKTHAWHEEAKNEKKILSERFTGRPSVYDSIHDSVMQKNGVPLGQVKPVSTILAAIGINDRYTFIRELFNNDPSAFERTIRSIDEAPDFNTAYNYLTDQFDWNMDGEVVQTLLEIIRRKHIRARNE